MVVTSKGGMAKTSHMVVDKAKDGGRMGEQEHPTQRRASRNERDWRWHHNRCTVYSTRGAGGAPRELGCASRGTDGGSPGSGRRMRPFRWLTGWSSNVARDWVRKGNFRWPGGVGIQGIAHAGEWKEVCYVNRLDVKDVGALRVDCLKKGRVEFYCFVIRRGQENGKIGHELRVQGGQREC